MSWLLPRLRPGSTLRLGASRHALPALSGGSDAALWASPLQALLDGQAAYVACSQQARRLTDASQPAKSAASAEEEARLRKVRWRQWADEQLQQRPADVSVQPLPAGSADNMSPEVAAAVQRQEPFIRRPPSSAAQQPAALQPLAAEAQPVSDVHLPAEGSVAAAEVDAADVSAVADDAAAAAAAAAAPPSAEASLAQRLGLRDLASNVGERVALQTAALDEQSGAAERVELGSPAARADTGGPAAGDGAFAAAAQQAAAEQVAMAEAQIEANPGGVGAALQQRDDLLSGNSTPEAAEALGLHVAAPEQAAQHAPDAADVALEDTAPPQPASAPEPPAASQQEVLTQQRSGQRQASAEWDAFVAAQAGQGAPQQLAAAAPPEAEAQPPPQHQRAFRGQTAQLFGPGPDPRTGYGALAAREGERLPLPYAPPRLHPTRDFFPGQFYRPADLNPFVPAETSQHAPASRRIEQAKPTAAEALAAADYRNVGFLARFMTDTGRIVARRRSGLQAKVHRRIARQIKVAKMMALAPIDSRPPVGYAARPVAPQGGRRGGPGAARGSHSAAAPPAAASTDDEDEL